MTQSITDLFVLRHKLMKKLFPERRKELPVSTQISLFKPSNMTKPDIDGMGINPINLPQKAINI